MTATQQIERKTYDVPVAGKILGLGRGATYEAVRRGEIRAVRIGKRLVVPAAEIDRILNGAAQRA